VRLNALAREGEARERAYAVVALADASRARSANAFEPATVVEITGRRGLGHPEKLNRVAAAVGLAYGALESTDAVVAQLIDTTVIDTLIDGVGGEHFRDFESLAEPMFGALRRLSGQDLPSNAVEWAKWWQRERGQFHARRELKNLAEADVAFAWVRFESIAADGSRRSAVFAAEGAVKPGAYMLPRETFASLVEALRDVGIFDLRAPARARADEHVSVTLGVRTLESRVTLAPGDDRGTPRYSVLRARFESLEEANLWQRYRDTDAWPDAAAWRSAASAEMAQSEPEVRADLIRSAIVNAWDDLPSDEARVEALDRLERIGGLTRAQARTLLKAATGVPTMAGTELRAVGLALAGGPDEETRAAAVEALSARSEPAAVDLLANLLAQGGVESVRSAFADARPPVRQAAARAAASLVDRTDADLDPEAVLKLADRLRPGLEVLRKDEPRVRVAALLALVRLGDGTVMPEFDALYEGGDLGTKVRVTEAMAWVPGDRSHGLLTRVLAEPGEGGGALRAAALRSMARTNHPNSVSLLKYYLLTDLEPEVQKAAGDALVDLGSEDARFAVIEALTSGEKDAGRRARLVDVVGRFSGQVVEEVLQRQLDDTAQEVVAAAAIRAGEKGLPASVPHLIALLRLGNDGERDRALAVLEELTCQRIAAPGYGVKADQYEAWWATAKAGNDRSWFRDALIARGYDVGLLIPYVRNEPGYTPVPLLLRVLRDEDPSLRHAAARALERLSGRSFGAVGRGVPAVQAARVATAWSEWWEREGRTAAPKR
jgi:HEAT repeat protein